MGNQSQINTYSSVVKDRLIGAARALDARDDDADDDVDADADGGGVVAAVASARAVARIVADPARRGVRTRGGRRDETTNGND